MMTALEGDEFKELRKRLDLAADAIYQHEGDEWTEIMAELLAKEPPSTAVLRRAPQGEVT